MEEINKSESKCVLKITGAWKSFVSCVHDINLKECSKLFVGTNIEIFHKMGSECGGLEAVETLKKRQSKSNTPTEL